jgi:uncharacterized membrane protein
MLKTIITMSAGAVSMAVIDYLWLGIVMKNWIISKIGTALNVVNGSVVPNVPATIAFYFVAAISIIIFVLNRLEVNASVLSIFLAGALFGGLMYAFYDLTNMATLRGWSWHFVALDIVWGAFLVGVTSVIMYYVSKLF